MAEMNRVLHFLQPATEGWNTHALTASAVTNDGVDSIWHNVLDFKANTETSGEWQKRRKHQDVQWMHALIEEALRTMFYRNPMVNSRLPLLERDVAEGKMPPAAATLELLERFRKSSQMDA
jgi:LAO/AO transport system kinase